MPDTQPISIKEILEGKHTDKTITVRGWIYRTRSSGNIIFMTIRDVTGIIQATIKTNNVGEEQFSHAKKALIESSLTLTGTANQDHRAPGGYELQVSSVQIHQYAEPFPITKDQSPEFLLDQRHLPGLSQTQGIRKAVDVSKPVSFDYHRFDRFIFQPCNQKHQ